MLGKGGWGKLGAGEQEKGEGKREKAKGWEIGEGEKAVLTWFKDNNGDHVTCKFRDP